MFYVVVRLVHFVGGSVASMPCSFHKSETEAQASAKNEVEKIKRKFAVNGTQELMQLIGIHSINFQVGAFESSHEDLIQTPRIILPAPS
jgi:hypothetical protein